MGGASLIEALPEMPAIRAAVIDSAYATLGGMVDHQFRFAPKFSRPTLRLIARAFAWLEVGIDIESVLPVQRISRISIPLLLIHGAGDQIVPMNHVQQLYAARPINSRLHIEPGSPHIGMAILNPVEYRQLVQRQFDPKHLTRIAP